MPASRPYGHTRLDGRTRARVLNFFDINSSRVISYKSGSQDAALFICFIQRFPACVCPTNCTKCGSNFLQNLKKLYFNQWLLIQLFENAV